MGWTEAGVMMSALALAALILTFAAPARRR